MYELTESNYDIQNEYIDFLDKKYIFRKLDNMSQLKILTYLLPYEIHRLSKKTFTKKIKYKIFKIVKRKGRKIKNNKNRIRISRKDWEKQKNINLFYKGLRLSYKFTYHRCKNLEFCRDLIDTDYKLWDDEKAEWVEDNDNKPKNKFYYGFCSTCENYKKNIYNNRNMRYFESNGKCLLLDSSDEEPDNVSGKNYYNNNEGDKFIEDMLKLE